MKKFILILFIIFSYNLRAQQIIWEKLYSYTSTGVETINSITNGDSASIICSYFSDSSKNNVLILKYDSSGTLVWSKPGYAGLNGCSHGSIVKYINGNYIYLSSKSIGVSGNSRIVAQEVDSNGDTLGNHFEYGDTTSNNCGNNISVLPDGGFIISADDYPKSKFFLLRANSLGDTLWYKSWGGPYNESNSEVFINSKGYYILYGNSNGFYNVNPPYRDHPYFLKINPNGDSIYSKQVVVNIQNSDEDIMIFNSAIETMEGDYAFSCGVDTNSGITHVGRFASLTLIDSLFNKKWSVLLRPTLTSYYRSSKVSQLTDSSFVVLAHYNNYTFDIFKISKAGLILNKKSFTSSICSQVLLNDLIFLGDSSIVVSGSCGNNAYIARVGNIGIASVITTPTALSNPASQNSIAVSVFPNPFTNSTEFNISGGSGKAYNLSLINSLGETIQSYEIKNQNTFTLNRTDIPSGLYFYLISDEDGKSNMGKLVVE